MLSAGITRIISRNRILNQLQEYITAHPPLCYVDIPDTDESTSRRLKIVMDSGRGPTASKESVAAARKKRKQMQSEEKERKRLNREKRAHEDKEREESRNTKEAKP